MLLHLCTWAEVGAYLEGSAGIIVPIGSTEQHGPNGLIGTDSVCAEAIGRAVGETVDALVAPTINVGMSQHHMAFPGSMTLRPQTLIEVIRDNVASLACHGFARFYFVNGHGGNIASVQAAFSAVYADSSLGRGNAEGVRCTLRNWYTRPEVREIAKALFGDSEGYHATPSEVAVTQYLYPNEIKAVPMEPAPKAKPEFADAADYRRRFPDGRMCSDPSLATPEHGERIFKAAVAALAED